MERRGLLLRDVSGASIGVQAAKARVERDNGVLRAFQHVVKAGAGALRAEVFHAEALHGGTDRKRRDEEKKRAQNHRTGLGKPGAERVRDRRAFEAETGQQQKAGGYQTRLEAPVPRAENHAQQEAEPGRLRQDRGIQGKAGGQTERKGKTRGRDGDKQANGPGIVMHEWMSSARPRRYPFNVNQQTFCRFVTEILRQI